MDLGAWCGHCGESFRLLEVLDGGAPGRCPRCGFRFAPGYVEVLAVELRGLAEAADRLVAGARQLDQVAPALHLDRRKLAADLDRAVEP